MYKICHFNVLLLLEKERKQNVKEPIGTKIPIKERKQNVRDKLRN